jgi:hypothetical protein
MKTTQTEVLSEDAAFRRLEELVAELPAMEQQGQRLSAAREARQLRQLAAHYRGLDAEWQRITSEYEALLNSEHERSKGEQPAGEQLADEQPSEGQPSTGSNEATLAKLRYLSEYIAVRRTPHTRAHEALEAALQSGTLTLDSPLDELALSDEDFAALEQLVADYQAEYRQVLARCQELGE